MVPQVVVILGFCSCSILLPITQPEEPEPADCSSNYSNIPQCIFIVILLIIYCGNLHHVISPLVKGTGGEAYQRSLKAQPGWNWIVSGYVCLESRVKACWTLWGTLSISQKSTCPCIPRLINRNIKTNTGSDGFIGRNHAAPCRETRSLHSNVRRHYIKKQNATDDQFTFYD